jgi:hypothetical protein
MSSSTHPLAQAIAPLVDAVGGSIVAAEDIEDGDIELHWNGKAALGVRIAEIVSLDRLVATVEDQLGAPLAKLDRADKQRAVRMLDERGAFRLRKSIEEVGAAMGVSRITIYNYLNAPRES